MPATPSARAAMLRSVGRTPSSGQANTVVQIGIVKTSSAAPPTVSQTIDNFAKPIQTKTFSIAAKASGPIAPEGTDSRSPRAAAISASPHAAARPAVPRAKKGGQSCRMTFMIGQFTP